MRYVLMILGFALVTGCTTNKNSLVFMDQKQGVFWRSAAGGLGAGSDVENTPEGGMTATVPVSGTVPGLESIGALSSIATNMPKSVSAK